ncbi:MAG: hypothetical protein V9E99_09480 [Microthrixaceae bacterium]
MHAHRSRRDGAGLVEAHHVDASERLDGGQLLHQRALPGKADHADGERDAREEHEALGNHAHHAGHRGDERLADVGVAAGLGPHQHDPRGDERP